MGKQLLAIIISLLVFSMPFCSAALSNEVPEEPETIDYQYITFNDEQLKAYPLIDEIEKDAVVGFSIQKELSNGKTIIVENEKKMIIKNNGKDLFTIEGSVPILQIGDIRETKEWGYKAIGAGQEMVFSDDRLFVTESKICSALNEAGRIAGLCIYYPEGSNRVLTQIDNKHARVDFEGDYDPQISSTHDTNQYVYLSQRLVKNSDGTYFFAFADAANDIRFFNSTDLETWNYVSVLESNTNGWTGITTDSQGGVVVVFATNSGGIMYANSSDGITFSTAQNMATPTSDDRIIMTSSVLNFGVVGDSSGVTHVSGSSDKHLGSYADHRVYYWNYSASTGCYGCGTEPGNWTLVYDPSNSYQALDTAISVDSNNNPYVVVGETASDDILLFDKATGWETITATIYDGTTARYPSMYIDNNDNLYVTFSESGTLYLANSSASSKTNWSVQSIATNVAPKPATIRKSGSNLVVIYGDAIDNGTIKYVYSGDDWNSSTTLLSFTQNDYSGPQFYSGNNYLSWDNTGTGELYYYYYNNTDDTMWVDSF